MLGVKPAGASSSLPLPLSLGSILPILKSTGPPLPRPHLFVAPGMVWSQGGRLTSPTAPTINTKERAVISSPVAVRAPPAVLDSDMRLWVGEKELRPRLVITMFLYLSSE